VGEKAPNEYGIYDLSGNVWEWCHDRYGPYPGVAAVNPIGPETGDMRAIRGGAWSLAAPSARIANRNYASPVRASNDLGFRIARTLF
ncbi:MAG TPA: SUMF1/EgtB/PvdO family nonheme iron enzyme, partial [Thermotogota bacterium]|nr:SUMF1/EgtB/PvdO family nonheme iron enzyme [Thermotogota bacterium]